MVFGFLGWIVWSIWTLAVSYELWKRPASSLDATYVSAAAVVVTVD